jgi:hypothetical protein
MMVPKRGGDPLHAREVIEGWTWFPRALAPFRELPKILQPELQHRSPDGYFLNVRRVWLGSTSSRR